MVSTNASDIEKAHTLRNIRKQLLANQHRTLPNVQVMKVFKKATEVVGKDDEGAEKITYTSAFPPGDFLWWHNPNWGDGEWAILVPIADAPTFERMLKKPRQSPQFKYEFEMEEIHIDLLMLTYCEIARFLEHAGGEAAVLRFIGHEVAVSDEITKESRVVRAGYLDTVRLAEYTEQESIDVAVAFTPVGEGMYKDTPWKDVPLDYVKAVGQGRMGPRFQAQQLMAREELARRDGEKPSTPEPEKAAEGTLEPSKEGAPLLDPTLLYEHRCEAKTATGERCKMNGTVESGDQWFCQIHAKKMAVAGKTGGDG